MKWTRLTPSPAHGADFREFEPPRSVKGLLSHRGKPRSGAASPKGSVAGSRWADEVSRPAGRDLPTPLRCGQRSRPRAGAGGPTHPLSQCGRRTDGGSCASERRVLRIGTLRTSNPATSATVRRLPIRPATSQIRWRVPPPGSNTCRRSSPLGDRKGVRPCSTGPSLSNSPCQAAQ